MEIQEYINQQMDFYEALIAYLSCDEEVTSTNESHLLENVFQKQNISEGGGDILETLIVISKISANYHRSHNFFSKIEKILLHYLPQIKQTLTKPEIIRIFKYNKRILLFLFEQEIITPDEFVFQLDDNHYTQNFNFYFYPEIKDHQKEEDNRKIEEQLFDYTNNKEIFYQKRQIGENDNYICQLIRNDSIDEFVAYVNKTEIPLSSQIPPSIYETNEFLNQNKPTIIEYAMFFGSIQIIQYLLLKGIELTPSLLFYAIHSNNAEMIQLLEENQISPQINNKFKQCIMEAVKCHHNNIAAYIIDNIDDKSSLYTIDKNINDNLISCIFEYHNHNFLKEYLNCEYAFYYFCQFGYYNIVKFYLKQGNIDLNASFILK